jgi:Gluconate 2-dehydrogenase subunit 3
MSKQKPEPLADPRTGRALPQTDHPGYYPGFSTLRQQAYWDAATRRLVLDRVQNTPPIRFFTPAEAATMLAVVERILPQDDRTPARRIPILPVLDERLHTNRIEGYRYEDMPPDGEAYRMAVRAFEAMAQELHGRPFHELEVRAQEEILRSIHDGEPLASRAFWQGMNIERFWSMLVSDCAGAYYAHPWAWDEIGFGGPAYPRGYMRLEEGEPEPWEADEQRYAWEPPADTLSGREEAAGQGKEHQTHPGQAGSH